MEGDALKQMNLRGEITGYTSSGDGVCRLEGRAVYCPPRPR